LLSLPLAAWAADTRITSVDVSIPDAADLPVVRGIMQTKPGSPCSPAAVAGDLRRLETLGLTASKLALAFDKKGVAVSLALRAVERPVRPALVAIELKGCAREVARTTPGMLRQRPSTLVRARPFDAYALLLDIRTIEREHHAGGYLDARVTRAAVAVDEDGERARAEIHVEPGRRFILGQVTVGGNRAILSADLIAAIKLPAAAPWGEPLRRQIEERAARFCHEQAYLDARVEAKPERKPDGRIDLRLELTEGDRFILNNALVRGADDVKKRVAKLITLRRGEPVRQSEIDALRRAIDDLGILTGVEMLFVPLRDKPPGCRDLVIRLTKLDLGRKIGDAEKLYCEMIRSIIRLYNRGDKTLKTISLTGSVTLGGKQTPLRVAISRPDYAHILLGGDGTAPPLTIVRDKKGTVLHAQGMKQGLAIPASLALKVALLPPDRGRGLLTRMDVAPGLAGTGADADVLVLGERCPPVAAYSTEHAKRFARTPPRLDLDGALLIPAAKGGVIRIALGPDKLPSDISVQDANGTTTAKLRIEINAEVITVTPPAEQDAAAGAAITAPALLAVGMPQVALELADAGVREYPKSAACRAARGLVRLATGPPEPGLADLREATKLSEHPAYALLLAETLLRGGRFAEAKAASQAAAKAPAPKAKDTADVLLDAGISLRAALGALLAERADIARRTTIDRTLAHIGLGEYDEAAALTNGLLAKNADDARAAELLARAHLGRGDPKAALIAVAKTKPKRRTPEADIYIALAHHALGDDDKAAAALARAIAKQPALRNLLLLQQRTARIHKRYGAAAEKTALAKLFSRAVMGRPGPKRRALLAAIVNDAFVLRADLDALADVLARRDDLKGLAPAAIRRAALNQIVEDMLVIRWAMWRGITVRDDDVRGALRDEMRRLGIATWEKYEEALRKSGSDFARRAAEARDALLKQGAFAAVLAERALVHPADIRAAYRKDVTKFKVPPTARLRMITLEFKRFPKKEQANALALALRRRLVAKPDLFAKLAREYSHGPNAKRGGLWENVAKSSLIDPLDEAVFALKPGATSDVVQSKLGCHIVRLETLTPERTIPLEEAAAQVARSLQEERARAEVAAWLKRLRAESYVEIFDE